LSNPTPAPLETLPATSQPYWPPSAVQALGTTPGEGVWTPYIQEKSGATVAYRTFLQPDPQRLYALVGIVAFDLARTRLHYQLGRVEPFVPGIPPGSGEIPPPDIQDGALLAAFNGGFKAVNGHFGVYFNGETILPPLDKMGTVAIYSDGHTQIGEWGTDLSLTPDIIIYRQNCPLMVHKGEINPLVYNNSVNDWGGTLKGNVETLRSGIGISQDGRVLYYFAGNNLNMPSLAQSMLIAGAYQAMQLDINNYWVIYTRFTYQGNQILTDSLLPKYMYDKVDRFLYPYARDFFYLTSVTHDGSD
jgi:hypothetical protein